VRIGLPFDTGVCFPQLPELAAFAQALPELTIILNHLGSLTRVGPYANRDDEVLTTWRRGIAAVAACPNVHLKLGGIGMPRLGFDWHERPVPIGSEELAQAIAPLMTYCIEQFGPNRYMFESNFPVDKVSFSHHVLFNAFKRLSQGTRPRSARPCSMTRRCGPTGSAMGNRVPMVTTPNGTRPSCVVLGRVPWRPEAHTSCDKGDTPPRMPGYLDTPTVLRGRTPLPHRFHTLSRNIVIFSLARLARFMLSHGARQVF
jgi:hypothetical protein